MSMYMPLPVFSRWCRASMAAMATVTPEEASVATDPGAPSMPMSG